MANEPTSSISEQNIELMGSLKNNHFSPRITKFLNHVTEPPYKPAPISQPTKQSNPSFKGWKPPPAQWAEWVDHMAGKYSAVWIKSGVFDSIMSSIYEIPCNPNLISKLSHFWNPNTNTFVFPWGEVTITLEDVTTLSGFSVVGDSVFDCIALAPDLAGKVEVMNRLRSELVKSKTKKASHSKWIQMFMKGTNGHEHEHIAFLALWLSRFVFPSVDPDSVGKHVIPIAVRLSGGVRLAFGPAILAYVYHNLTKLKEESNSNSFCVNLLGPFQLVQIWGYERFPGFGPKCPNELRPGEPRLARWHALNSNVINFERFIWRPYAVDLKNWKQPLYYQDSEQILSDSMVLDDDYDLKSFVRFITPCELNGLGCKAAYNPHRVAMQFGFDQDIPGDIFNYELSKVVTLFVPSRSFEPGVSKRYYDWWKNGDRTGFENDQDSSSGERMDVSVECGKFEQECCDKKCDVEFVDLSVEDGFDDILVSLKRICNATKRKINSLKESYVGVPQSKKEKLGNEANNVIIID